MTSRNTQYLNQRQWQRHKRSELTTKEAAQAVADVLCIVCGGTIENNVCSTCDSEYLDGQRVREWNRCPDCKMFYRIKEGHTCEVLPFSDEREITS